MKILHGIKQKYSPIKIQVWREVAGNRLLVISELFLSMRGYCSANTAFHLKMYVVLPDSIGRVSKKIKCQSSAAYWFYSI